MKKKLKKSRAKRITEQQREVKERNKAAAMEARKALGFDKMKIAGIKAKKYDTNEIPLKTQGFISLPRPLTSAQIQQIYAKTLLNP